MIPSDRWSRFSSLLRYVSVWDDVESYRFLIPDVPQAIGMLFKRGSTISAAEGGCQAEVGGMVCFMNPDEFDLEPCLPVACSMASAGFAACMGGRFLFAQFICDTGLSLSDDRSISGDNFAGGRNWYR